MLSELTPIIGPIVAAVSAAGLVVSLTGPPAHKAVFSYNEPMFSCSQGLNIMQRIQKNDTITEAEREDLIRTLTAEMPLGTCTNN